MPPKAAVPEELLESLGTAGLPSAGGRLRCVGKEQAGAGCREGILMHCIIYAAWMGFFSSCFSPGNGQGPSVGEVLPLREEEELCSGGTGLARACCQCSWGWCCFLTAACVERTGCCWAWGERSAWCL